jgi:hypothetical protein
VDGGESTGALHQLDEFVIVAGDPPASKRTSQGRAERKGWQAASALRTGAHVEAESREEAGAEWGAPAKRATRTERGGREGAGEERLWTKDESERGEVPKN